MMPAQVIALARFSQAALTVLNARLFTLVGMLLAAAGFGYVLYQPDWIRAFAACAFAVLVFWPLQRLEVQRLAKKENDDEQQG